MRKKCLAIVRTLLLVCIGGPRQTRFLGSGGEKNKNRFWPNCVLDQGTVLITMYVRRCKTLFPEVNYNDGIGMEFVLGENTYTQKTDRHMLCKLCHVAMMGKHFQM